MSCNHLDDCSRCGGTVDYLEEMVESLEAKVNRLTQGYSRHSFDVTTEEFDDLSDEEKESVSDNGWGKECANYIRVCHDGKTLLLESDAIEPEDKNFRRDLSWISVWLKKAYELGKADALGRGK